MTAEVAVLDYGMGNLRSVTRALEAAGARVRVASDAAGAHGADRLAVPGQGAFGECMKRLRQTGLDELLVRHWEAERPYLGICLGLQVLFESSEEQGPCPGLALLPGQVRRLDGAGGRLKVPHMGWNAVRAQGEARAFAGLDGSGPHSWFYFVHSYAADPGASADAALVCDYGGPFCAGVERGPRIAIQFHPEKSQRAGRLLLERFLSL